MSLSLNFLDTLRPMSRVTNSMFFSSTVMGFDVGRAKT